jgi:hypothetical protein
LNRGKRPLPDWQRERIETKQWLRKTARERNQLIDKLKADREAERRTREVINGTPEEIPF